MPGKFGSSVVETKALLKWVNKILDIFERLELSEDKKISIPIELYEFFIELSKLLEQYKDAATDEENFAYWDQSYTLKEKYRKAISMGINGEGRDINIGEIRSL